MILLRMRTIPPAVGWGGSFRSCSRLRGHRTCGSPRRARLFASRRVGGGIDGRSCPCRITTICGSGCRRCTAGRGGRPTQLTCWPTCRGANGKKSELAGSVSIASRYGSYVGSQRHIRADLRGALPPCARSRDFREGRDDRVDGPDDPFRAAGARGAFGGAPCAVRACAVSTATRAQPSRRIHT